MNTILMTILLTLLGAGLVVLLVWLSVVSWKSIKFKKKTKKKIAIIETNSEQLVSNLYSYIDDYKKQMSTSLDEIYHQINLNFDACNSSINNKENTTHTRINAEITNLNNKIEKLDSAVDSRLDKMHDKVQNLIKDKNSIIK